MILRAGYHQTTKRLVRAKDAGDNFNPSNICVTIIGDNGTKYGALTGVFGEVDPRANVIDQIVYELTWDASGNWIMSFGDAGNEQVPTVPQIFLYHNYNIDNPVVLVWDESTLTYLATDLTLATLLINQYINGNDSACFYAEIEPEDFIIYDYLIEDV